MPPVKGDTAYVDDVEIPLGGSYGRPTGRVQIGVRPEFTRLGSGNDGLRVKLARVEDVGHHKIVRMDFFGTEINAIAHEGAEIAAEDGRATFDPGAIGVYVDDWRIEAQGQAA